jgi:hypothetical protein
MDKKEKALLNWGLVTLGTRPSSAKQALKKKDPKLPEIVLLGLKEINFGPFKALPTTNPPTSENIQAIKA